MAAKRRKKKTDSQTTPPDATSGRDFVAIADAYAQRAIADVDRREFCKWTRLAAARYVKDRKRAGERGASFYFDPDAASDPCDFIEKLPHIEGTWRDQTGRVTPDIVLHESHIFMIVNIFGFRVEDGTRRFTSALLAVARKNAKSTIAAAILLYCLCCEDELGMQVMSAATTGSQAAIIFKIARMMVTKTADLRDMFSLEAFAKAIVNYQMGGNFKAINAKASTQDGLNPSHTGIDEIHAHKNHDLINVLKSAAGARANPLWLYTTTEGYPNPGPWGELRHYGRQVLQGVVDAEHFFFLMFALDEEEGREGEPDYRPADNEFDPSRWIKANPLMTVNPVLAREIAKEAEEAKQMPGTHAEFKIKRCNRPAAGANAWLRLEKWKRNIGPVDLTMLEGKECFAGLDGASTMDLMIFRLLWLVDGIYYTWGWKWCPQDQVRLRTEKGTVPYSAWVEAKHIKATPGEAIDYEIVEADIIAICKRFKPTKIAYDPWNLRDLTQRLTKAGLTLEEFRQGAKSYHPVMTELENIYIAGRLRTNNDPVLNWCGSNLVPRTDANMAMAPDRKRSPDKIDDFVGLLMAKGAMGLETEPQKEYQVLFF